MVRVREPKKELTNAQIEAFAAKADGGEVASKRNFKSLNIPFSRAEYAELERLADMTGRSKANAIRWAIKEAESPEKSVLSQLIESLELENAGLEAELSEARARYTQLKKKLIDLTGSL